MKKLNTLVVCFMILAVMACIYELYLSVHAKTSNTPFQIVASTIMLLMYLSYILKTAAEQHTSDIEVEYYETSMM